jgi:ferredoxin
VLLLSDNKRGKWGVTVIKSAADYCIGCRMCEQRCPDFAILIDYEGKARGRKPERASQAATDEGTGG